MCKASYTSLFFITLVVTVVLRSIGDVVEEVTVPWQVLDFTNSIFLVGGVFVSYLLPWVFIPFIAGRVIDIAKNKSFVAALCMVMQILSVLLIIFMLSTGLETLWFLGIVYLSIVVISTTDSIHRYFVFTSIPELVGKNVALLNKFNSITELSSGIGTIIMYVLCGYLVAVYGYKTLWIDVACLTIIALLLIDLSKASKKKRSRFDKDVSMNEGKQIKFKELLSIIRRDPSVFSYLIVALGFNFFTAPVSLILINYLYNAVDKPTECYGFIMAISTLGSIIGSSLVVTYSKKLRYISCIIIGLLGEAVAVAGIYFIIAFSNVYYDWVFTLLLVTGMYMLMAVMGAVLNIGADTLFQIRIPEEVLGSFRGLFDSLATIPIALSYIIISVILETWGYTIITASLMGIGSILVVSLYIFYLGQYTRSSHTG
ncbi:MAG: MFS transporter [Staphylothermus sp.]|nr:MFS transporter [Staphylothermus sp.]